MKAYEHERAHSYEHSHHAFDFKSASLFQSLTTQQQSAFSLDWLESG